MSVVLGISNLLGPPFAGFLYDKYKIWHYTFGLGGMSIFISGVLLLILPCFRQAKLLHYQKKQTKKLSSKMQEVGEDGTSIFDILFYFSYKKYFFTRQTLDWFEIIGTFGTLSTLGTIFKLHQHGPICCCLPDLAANMKSWVNLISDLKYQNNFSLPDSKSN